MNSVRVKCLVVLLGLAVLGFGPVSVTGLIGLFVVLRRPGWFFRIVEELYRGRRVTDCTGAQDRSALAVSAKAARVRCFFWLTLLIILDILPVPVVSTIGLYVVLRRPVWFLNLVRTLYRDTRVRTPEQFPNP